MNSPTEEDNEDLLLSCRYGDIDSVTEYLASFGPSSLPSIHDESGNTILHMIAANGHHDILTLLLPLIPATLLSQPNTPAGSTPLHWAALNGHLDVIKTLIEWPQGPGIDLIEIKNQAGRSPLAEAEMAGFEEGAKYLVSVMKLDDLNDGQGAGASGSAGDGEVVDDDDVDGVDEVEIEIEDADGGIAKMTIGGDVLKKQVPAATATSAAASTSSNLG
ncbi:ankyrin [Pluteus cervinus]|uniref:Ankyrin n=1 Tax=Pluteus cervinus TaxID=181527 RepID=A0ACD3AEA8_9AGAR|nr:ankyrin [Pluteus cervinus]